MNLEFDDDLTCIFNDDNPQNINPRIRIMNEEGPKWESQEQNFEDDVFLNKIESNMLTKMSLRGILDINKVLIKSGKINNFDDNDGFNPKTEWIRYTLGVNMLAQCD